MLLQYCKNVTTVSVKTLYYIIGVHLVALHCQVQGIFRKLLHYQMQHRSFNFSFHSF